MSILNKIIIWIDGKTQPDKTIRCHFCKSAEIADTLDVNFFFPSPVCTKCYDEHGVLKGLAAPRRIK